MEAVEFEPAAILAELKAKAAATPPPEHVRDRLPLASITQLPDLFQPRGISEKHVSELARVIQNNGETDPVTVIQVGSEAVLIDGHHRLAAYELAGKRQSIPVRYFKGDLGAAVLEAGRANSKAKLPMQSQERGDFAWRLVLMDGYSRAQIAEASGVSPSQVANMRKARKSLGDQAFGFDQWWKAKAAAQGKNITADMSQDEIEVWKEEQANNYADRLAKEFGTKLARNTEIAAMALATYFGRKLEEVHRELSGHLPEYEGAEAEMTDDF